MASKASASTALLLSLNLLLFSMASTAVAQDTCSINALNLTVCADILGFLNIDVGSTIGSSPSTAPCCSLIEGLIDLDAAVCLCTAIRAGVLGIDLNVQVSLNLILNSCGKSVPAGFQCP